MVEEVDNKENAEKNKESADNKVNLVGVNVDKETLKIKKKIKWAFICFFSAWVLMIITLILGTSKSAGLKWFMQSIGIWFTLLGFLLFAISIILMFIVLGYLRRKKKEAKAQAAQITQIQK